MDGTGEIDGGSGMSAPANGARALHREKKIQAASKKGENSGGRS